MSSVFPPFMATFLIALFSVILVLICLFVTLLVLMQKPSANSGMGAALGGGAAEQAFGGEATNVLTRGTIYAIIAFFVLSFGLYLGTLAASQPQQAASEGASIGKLAEEQSAAAATEESADEAATGAAASEGEGSESAEAPVDPAAAVIDEVEGSAEGAIQEGGEASEEAAPPLQLETLDSGSTGSGS